MPRALSPLGRRLHHPPWDAVLCSSVVHTLGMMCENVESAGAALTSPIAGCCAELVRGSRFPRACHPCGAYFVPIDIPSRGFSFSPLCGVGAVESMTIRPGGFSLPLPPSGNGAGVSKPDPYQKQPAHEASGRAGMLRSCWVSPEV